MAATRMTLEQRAECIADTAKDGSAQDVERWRRVYDEALKMLRETERCAPRMPFGGPW